VTVQPVIDLNAPMAPVDGYEVPRRMREIQRLRNPADVFPFGACVSRRLDADHVVPYLHPDEGGPPGQTGRHNLALQVRLHHRIKTHGRWRLQQPEPGVYLWRSPTGWVYLVDAKGTHNLGRSTFARAVWAATRCCRGSTVSEPGRSLLEVGLRTLLHHHLAADRDAGAEGQPRRVHPGELTLPRRS